MSHLVHVLMRHALKGKAITFVNIILIIDIIELCALTMCGLYGPLALVALTIAHIQMDIAIMLLTKSLGSKGTKRPRETYEDIPLKPIRAPV